MAGNLSRFQPFTFIRGEDPSSKKLRKYVFGRPWIVFTGLENVLAISCVHQYHKRGHRNGNFNGLKVGIPSHSKYEIMGLLLKVGHLHQSTKEWQDCWSYVFFC